MQRCIDAVTPLFHFHVFQNVHDAQSVEYAEHEVDPFGSGAAYFLTESCEFQRFRLFTEPDSARAFSLMCFTIILWLKRIRFIYSMFRIEYAFRNF